MVRKVRRSRMKRAATRRKSTPKRSFVSKVEKLARHAANSMPAAERDIWSATDIQARWNISAPTFWRYRRSGHVPPPDAKIGPHDAWRRETILATEVPQPAAT
jgi:hypothetical protein